MRPKIIRISPYATTNADAVAESQTPAAGGIQELALDGSFLSGGVLTMDEPRQVVITTAADETAIIFLIEGTDLKGNQILEAVTGVDTGTVSTVRAFNTVTSIKVSGDTTGVILAGTLAVVFSNWVPVSYISGGNSFEVALAFDAGLAATTPDFTVEYTLSNILRWQGDDRDKKRIMTDFDLSFPTHRFFPHSTMVNLAADATGNLDFPVRAVRLKSNGVFVTGGVTLQIIQSGY